MGVTQAHEALRRADYPLVEKLTARALKEDSGDTRALRLHVRALLAMGEVDRARPLVERALTLDTSPKTRALVAEMLGVEQKRGQAFQTLATLISEAPEEALLYALAGEQRLRAGHWDQAPQFFGEAAALDEDGEALAHIRYVLHNMAEAIQGNKIPRTETLKFLNTLDNETGGVLSKEISSMRRHLSANQRPAAPPPQGASMEQSAERAPRAHESQKARAPRRPKPQAKTAFAKSLSEERAQNESLQQGLTDFGLSLWPSERPSIDEIAPVHVHGVPLAEQLHAYRNKPFRITSGELFTQIYMERCLHAMMRQLPASFAGALVLAPEEIAQLEINLQDGFFEFSQDSVFDEDLGETARAPVHVCALGTFIGEALSRRFGATWRYQRDPVDSRLVIGSHALDPFEIASQWFDEQRRGETLLQRTALEAQYHATDTLVATQRYEYIDLTRGLSDALLRLKLAEIWSFYRIRLARVASTKIAEGIDILHDSDELIVLNLDKQWAVIPTSFESERGAGKQGRFAMAYIRHTGEFFLLSSIKGLLMTLYRSGRRLARQEVGALIEAIKAWHCPASHVVTEATSARGLADVHGAPITAPMYEERGRGAATLTFWEITPSRLALRWSVEYDPTRSMPWSMERT